jgi:hypothetical protein
MLHLSPVFHSLMSGAGGGEGYRLATNGRRGKALAYYHHPNHCRYHARKWRMTDDRFGRVVRINPQIILNPSTAFPQILQPVHA